MNTQPNTPVLAVNNKLTEFLASYGRRRVIPSGEIFIKEGDKCKSCFVMLDGEAEILKQDEFGENNVGVRIKRGTIIGEMGVFLHESRSSSVRAATPLILLEFSAPSFYAAVENNSELALRIIRSLAEKLNAANKLAVSLRH